MVGAKPTSRILDHKEGRRAIISSVAMLGGWQVKHTPWPLVESMVKQAEVDPEKDTVMVLFNLEFLEVLHDRYGREYMEKQVTFIADSPVERMLAQRCYGVKVLRPSMRAWDNVLDDKHRNKHRNLIGKLMAKLNAPADITFTNPPYNGGLDLKILLALFDLNLIKRLLCVHPSTWLVDVKTQLGPKSGNPTFRKFQDAVEPHLRSVHMFNGNPVFGIGLFVPCVVTDLEMGWTRGKTSWIDVHYVGDAEGSSMKASGLSEITLHGQAWRTCMMGFFQDMQKACRVRGSLGSSYKTGANSSSSSPVQLANIRGNHVNMSSDVRQVKEDFYTMVQGNPDANKGVRSSNPRQLIFEFATHVEQDNFLSFLQTDFARIALALTKTNQDLDQGQLDLVPWMDFSRSWTDDELFNEFGYPPGHPLREYAKTFLPDYHNLYPHGKTY